MATGRRMRMRFALLKRHIAALISIVVAASGLTFFNVSSAQAVALNDNTSVFQISFTGLSSLPTTQTLVSPYGLQAAWTKGTQPADSDWIDITSNATEFFTAAVPTSGAHGGVTATVPTGITTSDTILLTIRDNPNDALTGNLAGYLGAQGSGLGTHANAPAMGLDNGSAVNTYAKELISFGQFPGFKYLQNAFSKVPTTFSVAAKLPSTVTDLSYSFGNSAVLSSWNRADITTWDMSGVMDFTGMFSKASEFNQDLSAWDTSNATSMYLMFEGASKFNSNISTWDTSSVTTMAGMFSNASAFNQPIGSWDTSNVTTFFSMFLNEGAFNQSLSGWDTSKVTTMKDMFNNAIRFNGDVSTWNTSKVTSMSSMFSGAASFNRDISGWNTSKVTTMYAMFYSATAFNQPIGSWNTSSVTNMGGMFQVASTFNKDLSGWNTAKVTDMSSMFNGAAAFNGDVSTWNTSSVSNMSSMFKGAFAFNSDISGWNTSQVGNMSQMFYTATVFNANISAWDTSIVLDMNNMFFQARAFNHPIGSWTTRSVTNMTQMFSGAEAFNQPLSSWNTSNVKNMTQMFKGALAFNSSVSGWDVSNVTFFESMFSGASSFNQSLNSWNPVKATSFAGIFYGATSFDQPLLSFKINTPTGTANTPTQKIDLPAGMSQANVETTLAAWANQTPTGTMYVNLASNRTWYSDCRSYNAYLRLSTSIIKSGGATNPAVPTGCVTSTITWAPTLTNSTPTASQGMMSFTPDAMPAGVSEYRFTSLSRYCQVDPISGVVSYSNSASDCVIRAYDNNPNGSLSYVDAAFALTIYTVPSQVRTVNYSLTGTSLKITWATPLSDGGSPITRYEVRKSGALPTSVFCIVPSTTFTCTFTPPFAPDVSYLNGVYVYAVNEIGYSTIVPAGYTNVVWDLAPGAPTITSLVPGTGLGLSLEFTPGTVPGTAITAYEYSTDAGTTWRAATWTSPSTTLALPYQSVGTNTPFVSGTTYSVKLRAKTAVIAGEASAAMDGTPLDRQIGAPTITSYSASQSKVTATFTAPALTGSAISTYQYSTDDGASWRTRTSGTNTIPLEIALTSDAGAALVDNTTYIVRIRAVTGAGSGVASSAFSMTPNRPPTAPTSPVATLNGTTATLTWSASTVGLGLTYSVASTPAGFSCSVTAPTTTCDATGLTSGTSYTFKVTATNSAGTAISTASNSVTPDNAPGAPTITGVTVGIGQLSVAFTAGTNSGTSLTKYQYSTDGGSNWSNFATNSVSSPQVITGLTSGTSYDVKLRAFNTTAGVASATVTAVPGLVPGAPTSVSAVAGAGSATISWTAPASNGGVAISSYTATSSTGNKTCTISSPATSCDVTGLTNGQSYTFTVTATNSIGISVASSASSAVVPESAPVAPTITSLTPSNQQLSVAFTAGANLGSSITKYQYSLDGGSSWVDPLVGVIASPLIITGLTNGTSYNVQIRGVNTLAGVSSGASSATPATVPGAPTTVTAVAGGGLATVSWTAPASNGGASVTSYTATSSTGNKTCTVSSPATSCDVTGLTNGQSYTFTVKATNSIGVSVASVASAAVIPDVAPGAPTITGITSGDSQLSISFTEGSNSGSAITKYQYSTDGSTWKDVQTDTTPLIITTNSSNVTLVNNTLYNVQIRAFNTLSGSASTARSAYSGIAPAAPSGVHAIDINNPGTVLVFWTAPSSPSLTDFKVEYTTNINGSWTNVAHTASTSTTMNVSGLTSGSTYYFRVSALNGNLSSASVVTEPVYIKYPQVPLAWITTNTTLTAFGTLTLAVSGGSGNGLLRFDSSNPSCTITGNILTAGNAGTSCTISASKGADNTYGSIGIGSTITITVVKQNQATTPYLSSATAMNYGSSLTLEAAGGSGLGSLSYAVDNAGTTGCSLNPATRVLSATSTGTCRVSVQRGASTNYFASTIGYQDIVVNPAPQTITFTSSIPTNPIAGATYIPSATSTSGLAASFSIQSGSCTISAGTVTFATSGSCVIKASNAGNSLYAAAANVFQTISVGQRNQVLEFTSASRGITQKTFGDSAFLIEATSSESAANVTYSVHSSTTNSACSVTSAGLVSVLDVGSCVIEADAVSSSAFSAASPVLLTIPVVSDIATAPFITSVSAGNQSITVNFTAPSYDGGTAVTGYQVAAVPQSGSTPTMLESGCSTSANNGVITCTVRGLANGIDYKVKVAGINAAGLGLYSDLSNALTVATNPSAVQGLNVVQNNAQLVIGWSDPDSLGGGTFQEYRVFVKRSSSSTYDQNNYYVVGSASTHSLTITTETPSGTALSNGVAYDIKVITVTTANSSELTANTAVVNQIPRTVPDAPRFSSAFIMGANIVLTWETPESDGGAPISAYAASVESSPCTFATVTDTVCTVPLPSSSYSVGYEVMAVNVAGQSTPATGTLQISVPPAATAPTQTVTRVAGGTSSFTQTAAEAVSEPTVTVHQDTTPSVAKSGKKASTNKPQKQELGQAVIWWLLIFLVIALILFFIIRRAIRKEEI